MPKSQVTDTYGAGALTWVPRAALNYVAHTEGGASIRALARQAGCHASTVSRQVRTFEARRDDVLVDDALRRLGPHVAAAHGTSGKTDATAPNQSGDSTLDPALTEDRLKRHAVRVLRRLCESGAVLAVGAGMDKAVVVREYQSGTNRTAVVDRDIAEAMALNAWIQCDNAGRVSRYRVTSAGRSMLAQLLAEQENAALGITETSEELLRTDSNAAASDTKKRQRFTVSESPLILLSRRRDKDGARFLPDGLVRAGERLREDFEMAQLGDPKSQNWDAFLSGTPNIVPLGKDAKTVQAARDRVTGALRDLGPGLGDVVLRCCCFLEGLESAEKDMGWSARSGKIVLRIALQRLKRHYDQMGEAAGMMG
ncbi:DUF6456 domain-containing protein [Roseovarius phycicola]|uniref:DUF6456 domain-containing protein n=1 Tax=Roseovarius phycicola TaxID=3080976 RepID=A0ABZ2HDW6_9RHOB